MGGLRIPRSSLDSERERDRAQGSAHTRGDMKEPLPAGPPSLKHRCQFLVGISIVSYFTLGAMPTYLKFCQETALGGHVLPYSFSGCQVLIWGSFFGMSLLFFSAENSFNL